MATPRTSTTRRKIVKAAFETLRHRGYAESSARNIAARGRFNQALIFYHFGSVEDLLIAALDYSTEARLARYKQRVAAVETLPELVSVAKELFAADVRSGHVRVLAQLVAGGAGSTQLGRKVAARVEPWLAFTRESIDRVLPASPLATLVPSEDLAFALTSLYLGMQLMLNLDGDITRAERLFDDAARIAAFAATFIPSSPVS